MTTTTTYQPEREAELLRLGETDDGVTPILDGDHKRIALIETVSHFWGHSHFVRCISQELQTQGERSFVAGPYGSEQQALDAFRRWFDGINFPATNRKRP